MNIGLFKELASTGWHASIMTTYSVDPAFYDGSIAWRLRAFECENNMLLADAGMLSRALLSTPESFRDAGRKYVIVPVSARGCFHPKLHLRLGRDGARLIIGSANATAAGWGRNQEIVTLIDWSRRSTEAGEAALGPLIAKAYDYVGSWLQSIPGEAVEYKVGLHRRDSPWLKDLAANTSAIELSDGSAVDLIAARGDGVGSILVRFAELVGETGPSRVTIISPYWDRDLAGLKELQRLFNPKKTVIGLNAATNEFPVEALRDDASDTFIDLEDGTNTHRFLHAKVIVVETQYWDHVLFGSANCSDDALGTSVVGGRNAELCIYRRLPRGQSAKLLGLDYRRTLSPDDINPVTHDPFESGSSPRGFEPGVMEIFERALSWWPAPGIKAAGAEIMIGENACPARDRGNGRWEAWIEGEISFPLVVVVRLQDGRLSPPRIVHDQHALRIAAPGLLDRRLRNAFDKVLAGEEDIIDLAHQAHLLFVMDDDQEGRRGRATGTRAQKQADIGKDYSTSEEFRQGVTRNPATGMSGLVSLSDPGLLELLRIVLRGVLDVDGRAATGGSEGDDGALEAGEQEDGDETAETAPTAQSSSSTSAQKDPDRQTYTPEQIAVRRRKLSQAIDAFETMLSELDEKAEPISSRLCAQTAFILDLMLYACNKKHARDDGTSVYLMEKVPESGVDRDLVFAVRAARLLRKLWVGNGRTSIVDRLEVDPRYTELPVELVAFVIMTRWTMARAYLAVIERPKRDSFEKPLASATAQIFKSTMRWGPIASDAEATIMRRLDARLGYTEEGTSRLTQQVHQFLKAEQSNRAVGVEDGLHSRRI